jgi:hypothetical protein
MTSFSNSYTSSTSETVGLNITGKSYSGGIQSPQGIVFSGGLIYGAYSNLYIDSGLHIDVNHNVLDGSTGNAVVANNPNGFQLSNNWILTTASGDSCIYVSAPTTNLDGLWIQNNEIVGTGTSQSQIGIFFASGTARRGVHIVDNRMSNVDYPMIFREVPQFSVIRNNSGAQNGPNSFMWLGSGGDYTEIDGNESADNQPIVILSGTSSTVRIGYNASPAGTTGP